jgi:hypothetical protein
VGCLEEFTMKNYTESFFKFKLQTGPQGWKPARGGRMRRIAISSGFILFILSSLLLAGCGGGSSAAKVTTVTVSPTALSLNSGDVTQINASATDASGNAVTNTAFTFTSSNPTVVSVSPGTGTAVGGQVCAGVWDANFVVCNGNDAAGNPLSGTATITVTASGISTTLTVSIHPKVTSVTVDPVPLGTCAFPSEVVSLTAHAFHNTTDITSQVGVFNWTSLDPSVATVDATGAVQAKNPGATGIFANNANTNSTPVTFKTCMPHRVILRLATDPAGGPTTSQPVIASGATLSFAVDIVDESGVLTSTAIVPLVSTNSVSANVSGLTLTAKSPGATGVVAACSPPTCGDGVDIPVYSNVVSVTVTGVSPTTTVYATTAFPPPAGTAATLVPIDTGTHVAGTGITLPGTPNSMVFARGGTRAYLGTAAGLVALDPTTNTVTNVAPTLIGKVLAVSDDGNLVILSTAANDPGTGTPVDPNVPNQRAIVFNHNNNTLQTFFLPGVVSARFDSDNFKGYMAATDGHVYVFSTLATLQTLTVSGSPVDVASVASDSLVYLANSASLDAFAVCNNQQLPAFLGTAHQLVQPVLNQDVMVAANSNGLDIDRVTVAPPAAANAICPPTASHNVQSVNFGLGALTARQLLVAPGGSHFLELPAGLNKLLASNLAATATVISLPAAVTEPLGGGMLLDGNTAWIGMGGTNTVDQIDLNANVDNVQVATSFKKLDGSPAPPNIVAVLPK